MTINISKTERSHYLHLTDELITILK
jgi:hypothetical protein